MYKRLLNIFIIFIYKKGINKYRFELYFSNKKIINSDFIFINNKFKIQGKNNFFIRNLVWIVSKIYIYDEVRISKYLNKSNFEDARKQIKKDYIEVNINNDESLNYLNLNIAKHKGIILDFNYYDIEHITIYVKRNFFWNIVQIDNWLEYLYNITHNIHVIKKEKNYICLLHNNNCIKRISIQSFSDILYVFLKIKELKKDKAIEFDNMFLTIVYASLYIIEYFYQKIVFFKYLLSKDRYKYAHIAFILIVNYSSLYWLEISKLNISILDNIFYSLCLPYIVTYMFFIMTVYLSNRKEKLEIFNIVNRNVYTFSFKILSEVIYGKIILNDKMLFKENFFYKNKNNIINILYLNITKNDNYLYDWVEFISHEISKIDMNYVKDKNSQIYIYLLAIKENLEDILKESNESKSILSFYEVLRLFHKVVLEIEKDVYVNKNYLFKSNEEKSYM